MPAAQLRIAPLAAQVATLPVASVQAQQSGAWTSTLSGLPPVLGPLTDALYLLVLCQAL